MKFLVDAQLLRRLACWLQAEDMMPSICEIYLQGTVRGIL